METFFVLLAFVRGIHRSPVNYPRKGPWRGALMFNLICVWIKGWVNNREAGDLRRYRTHYDVTVIEMKRKWNDKWIHNGMMQEINLLEIYTTNCNMISLSHYLLNNQCCWSKYFTLQFTTAPTDIVNSWIIFIYVTSSCPYPYICYVLHSWQAYN